MQAQVDAEIARWQARLHSRHQLHGRLEARWQHESVVNEQLKSCEETLLQTAGTVQALSLDLQAVCSAAEQRWALTAIPGC